MAYRLTLRSLARTDLDGIEAWYEHAAASIRDRLRHELDAAWEHLGELPLIGRPRGNGWHGLSLTRFPYTIWYLALPDAELVVVSRIIHDRRDPAVWPG